MLRIAICDDNRVFCRDLESKLLEINNSFDIDLYSTLESLRQGLRENRKYDLLFLDIEFELEAKTGISLGNYIREELKDDYLQIAFVSSKTEYAMELFKLRPFDFLIKPLNTEDIAKLINKAIRIIDKGNATIVCRQSGSYVLVKERDIVYLSSSGRKIQVQTRMDSYELSAKLDDLQNQLKSNFIRIHKSFLVNGNYIAKIYEGKVALLNGVELPVSKSRKKEVNKYLYGMVNS